MFSKIVCTTAAAVSVVEALKIKQEEVVCDMDGLKKLEASALDTIAACANGVRVVSSEDGLGQTRYDATLTNMIDLNSEWSNGVFTSAWLLPEGNYGDCEKMRTDILIEGLRLFTNEEVDPCPDDSDEKKPDEQAPATVDCRSEHTLRLKVFPRWEYPDSLTLSPEGGTSDKVDIQEFKKKSSWINCDCNSMNKDVYNACLTKAGPGYQFVPRWEYSKCRSEFAECQRNAGQ